MDASSWDCVELPSLSPSKNLTQLLIYEYNDTDDEYHACYLSGSEKFEFLFENVWLEHKTSLKSLGYICSNSQKYIVWVKIIDFSFMLKLGY